ncbi:NUDIX domain-containing protein [Microbacterium sp. ARD32]|uniref:NUDIX domain-containing protein n=1 Tax=Microbacterium sp. ARD32 TaxID=2962577 RepID=UPI002882AC73|nr:NUDIX domain-containing protein [Microbacterium sp. ARD32]MDT0157190.1 NUDIX domain-containing protein [Microbacterium sp. ARD32]
MNPPTNRVPPRRITFIRHAMPRVDAAVSPDAWELSAAGVAAAAEHPLTVERAIVVSSPERKALVTTTLMTGHGAVGVDARFREVDRVERVHDDFRAARAAWISGRLDSRHSQWETPDAAAQRFHDGLLAHPADHLVVGTHGMVLTAWLVGQGLIEPGGAAVVFWESLTFPHVIELEAPLLRVRAVLTDADGRCVLIKRTRPGHRPYWTAPGGGVELADATAEDALRRELREELGAEASVGPVLFERQIDGIRSEAFYRARLISMDLQLLDGPELGDPARGNYDVEFVTRDRVAGLDVLPAELKQHLLSRRAAPRR